jgi:hypothetical protein
MRTCVDRLFERTHWYSLVLTGTHWYSLVLTGTRWYSLVLTALAVLTLTNSASAINFVDFLLVLTWYFLVLTPRSFERTHWYSLVLTALAVLTLTNSASAINFVDFLLALTWYFLVLTPRSFAAQVFKGLPELFLDFVINSTYSDVELDSLVGIITDRLDYMHRLIGFVAIERFSSSLDIQFSFATCSMGWISFRQFHWTSQTVHVSSSSSSS